VLSPELGKALSDIGGFALFLLTVVTAVVGLLKQWWVPGWVYRQERETGSAPRSQAIRNAESLEKLARAVTGDRSAPRKRPVDAPASGDGPH
jgi:hypothetical protein